MANEIREEAEECNRQLWDELAPIHFRAYEAVSLLRAGGSSLREIELREIGDVHGKSLLHLQCHIGTDTLSWARKGAIVTGVDFSAESIAYARRLQQDLQLEATFIESNIYSLPQPLDDAFDIVYTSRGVLCWLRNLDEWARIVARCLKPGGMFYLMEAHPMLNVFDNNRTGDLTIIHSYFHSAEPTLWDDDAPDYADESYTPQHGSYEWTWSVSDVIDAVIKAGLCLELFHEHDRLFYKGFPGMERCSDRWYHFPQLAGKLPLTFTVRARKPNEAQG